MLNTSFFTPIFVKYPQKFLYLQNIISPSTNMRFREIFLSIILPLLLLCSCSNNEEPTTPLKKFKMESAILRTYHQQNIEIKFTMEDMYTAVSATKDAEWITNLKVNATNTITATIAENSGNARSGKITLSAPGYANATIKLTQSGAPKSTANHTLMFYFFGTSLNRYFSDNIDDAKLAIEKGILGDNNRVIYFRHSSKSEGYIAEICLDTKTNKCFESIIEDKIYIDGNPISPSFIGNIINKMATLAPAERYGLVMAGHGQAWITREALNGSTGISQLGVTEPLFAPAYGAEITRAFGETNVQVNPAEIAEGIRLGNADIDYIIFDACFMSNIETIYELRNSANYIIASPCEIMGRGFPYERTLPHLFLEDGSVTDYDAAAESYYLYYRDEYNSSYKCGSIAVYDCSEIEALRDATSAVVATAREEYDTSTLQTYEGKTPHYFFDFGEWVNVVATDSSALQNFNTQLNNTVIAKYTLDSFYSAYGGYGTFPINKNVYSGVTTSAPSEKLRSLWMETEWYKSVWQL